MVLAAFSSGTRHKRSRDVKHEKLPVGQPSAVAFTAFAYVWPRAAEAEIGATLCAIGAGRTLTVLCPGLFRM